MAGRALSFLAASLLLLGVLLPTNVVAAPADKDGHVVPTAIHDRARAEGEVRVLVELLLPSGRVAEGAVPNQARALYRQEITDAAARLLSRLTQHPHRVLRRYVTAPLIALEAGPAGWRGLDASSSLCKRVTEDRIHTPVLLDSVPLIGADKAWAQGFDGTGLVVALIDTGVDQRHHEAGAVEALSPRLVGADERDTIQQDRRVNPVFRHPLAQRARCIQTSPPRRAGLERDQWRRHVSAKDTVRVLCEPAQQTRGGVGDLLAVEGPRLIRHGTLGNAAGGKQELDEDAHLAFGPRAVVDRRRHHVTVFVGRCRDHIRG